MSLDPVIGATIRLFMAVLFGAAATHKLVDFGRFVLTLRRYVAGVVSLEMGAPWLACGIIAVEIGIVVACVTPMWRVPAALSASLVLLVYAGAMLVNLRRGNLLLDCGCAWGEGRQPVSAGLVMRNIVLASLGLLIIAPVVDRSLTALDVVSILAGLGVAGFLYGGVNRLFAVDAALHDALRGMS